MWKVTIYPNAVPLFETVRCASFRKPWAYASSTRRRSYHKIVNIKEASLQQIDFQEFNPNQFILYL